MSHIRQNTDPRLLALAEILKKSRKSRRWLGFAIKRGPNAVQKWYERNQWPEREELTIESVLPLVPIGFFKRIAAGQTVDEALIRGISEDADEITHAQFRALFALSATNPEAKEKLETIKEHLRRQVQLLVDLSLPIYPSLAVIPRLPSECVKADKK